MGTLNNNENAILDLLKHKCLACNLEGIDPQDRLSEKRTFDYWCKSCRKYISISEMVFISFGANPFNEISRFQVDLREDIRHSPLKEYVIDTEVLMFFSGRRYAEKIEDPVNQWKAGRLPGQLNKYECLTDSDLEKIKELQKEVLKNLVDKKVLLLLERFDSNSLDSIDLQKQLTIEIHEIKDLLENEKVTQNSGNLEFGSLTMSSEFVSAIKKQYRNTVLGKDYFNYVKSPNQVKLAGKGWYTENALVFAIALNKYLDILSQRLFESQEQELPDNEEQKKILSRIDEVLYRLEKLEHGQEIVFEEIESLKIPLKKLSKKDFKQLVFGKIWELICQNIISSELAKEIITSLFGEVYTKLLQNF